MEARRQGITPPADEGRVRAQNSTCMKTSIKRAQQRLFHTRHKSLPTDVGSKANTGFESLGKEKTMINFVLYVG